MNIFLLTARYEDEDCDDGVCIETLVFTTETKALDGLTQFKKNFDYDIPVTFEIEEVEVDTNEHVRQVLYPETWDRQNGTMKASSRPFAIDTSSWVTP
jgi:hypothetical protein